MCGPVIDPTGCWAVMQDLPGPAPASARPRPLAPTRRLLHVRYHGQFAYIEGELTDGDRQPLIRLHHGGSASTWGFGLYLASSGKYENQILPTGLPIGTPQQALDCACDLYLGH